FLQPQTLPGQTITGQLFVFPSGRSDSEESSEEELNVMELRPRGKEQQRGSAARGRPGDVVLLERELTEEDSLNKLALQYGCKVSKNNPRQTQKMVVQPKAWEDVVSLTPCLTWFPV
uniref:Uncharacterized protein n=1 Tax=Zonotrichia albicollis TaxID=44394 RepID=A0A8D2ME88_ZONAL